MRARFKKGKKYITVEGRKFFVDGLQVRKEKMSEGKKMS